MKHNILLYPGGFKPFHDGHLCLLENVIFNEHHIDEVYIFIGNNPRDMITVEDSLSIITSCIERLKYLYDIPIYCYNVPRSPMTQCYGMINNDDVPENRYGLLSSCKDNDANRTHTFYETYLEGGRYNTNKWHYNKAFDIDVEKYDCSSINNDIILSSTYLRDCIKNNDWNNFIRGYEYMIDNGFIKEYEIKSLFDKYSIK